MFKLNDVVIVNGKYDGLEVKDKKGKIINTRNDINYCTVKFFEPKVGRHEGMNGFNDGIFGVENCYCYPLNFEGFRLVPKQLNLFED